MSPYTIATAHSGTRHPAHRRSSMKAHRPITRILAALLPLLASLFGVPRSAVAQESSERVAVHGFGEWAYGKTNGNQYLVGDHDGRYDNASLALNVVASVTERLRIVGEAAWHDHP